MIAIILIVAAVTATALLWIKHNPRLADPPPVSTPFWQQVDSTADSGD